MIRLKCRSVISRAEAAQRNAILPSRQRHTRRVRNRTPLYGLSIRLVVTRQRDRLEGTPREETVNISPRPSRKLAAALGYSLSNHCACFSSLAIPALAGSRKAARITTFTCSLNSLGR